ncbi:MAG: two-component system response regulator [Pirellulales bacterium]
MVVSSQHRVTILAIDDEAQSLEELSSVLVAAGYTCRCVQNPRAAAKAIAQLVPDLIISDINLAGYNGLTICEQLKLDAGCGNVPVMFLSASQVPDIIRRSHSVGGTYYVRKPFDATVLLELVAKALPAAQLSGA